MSDGPLTSYGMQLLAPFSRQRFASGAVAIIDPAYSLVLALALGLWPGWGVRVRLDAGCRPIGPGERFNRPLPSPPGELVGQIWRRTLGLS